MIFLVMKLPSEHFSMSICGKLKFIFDPTMSTIITNNSNPKAKAKIIFIKNILRGYINLETS